MNLVPISDVRPSTYNPRVADPRRLDVIELSLRKLGFLHPLYADENGELLSGHQRHHVAQRIGWTHVPVELCPAMDLQDRKALNIVFNRGTNDLQAHHTPATLTDALRQKDVFGMAARMPDKVDICRYPCMYGEQVPVKELIIANKGRWVNYARNMASSLARKGIAIPIVATRDLRVINGIGRLQYAAENSEYLAQVVWVSNEEAELADAMLNYLSMDFDIHNRYRDLLRYNSFRRMRRVRNELGMGFIFAVAPNSSAKDFDITVPENRDRWIKEHGISVVDFGAGHMTETELLRSVGIRVTPFEPFRINGSDEIDKEKSLECVCGFIRDVAAGIQYNSVFISSVLNSVPFAEDRKHIVCICAALCGPRTRLYAVASSTSQTGWGEVTGRNRLSEKQSKLRTFRLDYEPGIAIGDFSMKPKVQKYHTADEFRNLFGEYFNMVSARDHDKNAEAVCSSVKPVSSSRLRKAIEFEFDLPYPDGSRMNLVNEAKAAFSKRLGIQL